MEEIRIDNLLISDGTSFWGFLINKNMTYLTINIRIDKLTNDKYELSFNVLTNSDKESDAMLKNYYIEKVFDNESDARDYIKNQIKIFLEDSPKEDTRIFIKDSI